MSPPYKTDKILPIDAVYIIIFLNFVWKNQLKLVTLLLKTTAEYLAYN
jgi:hypothetical protein